MEKDGHPLHAQKAVSLEDFERSVYAQDFPKATQQLVDCLKSIRRGIPFAGYQGFEQAHYTRLAAAVVALFSAPKFKLSQVGFNVMACEYAPLDSVFKASAFGSSEHAFRLIGDGSEGLNKYLLLFPMDSALELDFSDAVMKDPQATIGLWMALISHPQVFSAKADERRERMIGLAHLFEDVELPQELLNLVVSAYMNVSYAHGEDKHRPKATLHRLLRGLMKEIPENHAPLVHKDRPTVLVALEWWWSKHAMYRCYAKSVMQLKERFRLVGMAREENTNADARAMFDDFVTLPNDNIGLIQVADEVRKVNPDIIYYPSIGMSIWTIAMASLRLAPLQVMSYGHPATTFSPCIDYGLIESDAVGNTEFSESLVHLPPAFMRHTSRERDFAPHVPKRGQGLRIAVPAMHSKVSWPFIQALQAIERRAPKPVTFEFFPYVGGAGMYAFGQQLQPLLQSKVVHERDFYPGYMARLAECDLALFSFPFGGTNSTVDACLLGLPMVAMEGEEIHAKTDAMIMRRAGLPEWLIAQDVEAYVETVLKLFDDDVRADVAAEIRAADLDSTIFADDEDKAFLNAFAGLYERHALKEAA